jgi:hypothetical protein
MSLSRKTQNYINKYQSLCKKIISEAWKRENYRTISRSMNHTKALWGHIQPLDFKELFWSPFHKPEDYNIGYHNSKH